MGQKPGWLRGVCATTAEAKSISTTIYGEQGVTNTAGSENAYVAKQEGHQIWSGVIDLWCREWTRTNA